MGYCAALNCRNGTSGPYKNSSVSFYGFPLQNKPLLWQWIQNMGRDMDTPSKYHHIALKPFLSFWISSRRFLCKILH
uniref:THAP-type domain-containing protein n=1 Tax=Cyanoderma ruficeps TaxID=181631 RepID=A0A8C3QRT2_9PASS